MFHSAFCKAAFEKSGESRAELCRGIYHVGKTRPGSEPQCAGDFYAEDLDENNA